MNEPAHPDSAPDLGRHRAGVWSIAPSRTELPLLVATPGAFVRRYWWALGVLLIGATADATTTLVNLARYGPGVEAHVVQRWVSMIVGVHAGVPLAKVLQLGFVLFVAAWWRPWCAWILCICGVLYAAAAVSNHFLLL